MRASRIFDNGSGDKFNVMCEFNSSVFGGGGRWDVRVWKKPKGKRKFIAIVDEDSWAYRKLEPEDREKYRLREYLKEIPWTWIEMAMDDVCAEIRELGNEIYPKEQ